MQVGRNTPLWLADIGLETFVMMVYYMMVTSLSSGQEEISDVEPIVRLNRKSNMWPMLANFGSC